jgi:hypothetical protein
MSPNLSKILFIIILGGAVLACSSITGIGDTAGSSSGDILFEDDFAYIFSGWPRITDEFSSTDYANNGYEIIVFEKEYVTWGTPGESFTNVDIQVDATFVSGEFDSYYGIICRHEDIDNFYALTVSNDGYYGIIKTIQAGPFTLLGNEFLEYSDSIKQGIDKNVLRAKCEDNRMAL